MPRPRRPWGRALALLVAGALAAGCAAGSGGDAAGAPGPGAGAAGTAPADEDWIARTDDDAVFTVDCPFSHRAPDDPIVHPGVPGASHSHDFFGSTATDAASTGEALLGTATTCEETTDTAAYWVPTLSVGGEPVEPTLVRAYYRARPGVDVRQVTAPPLGLAMLAGAPTPGHAPHGDGQHGDHGGSGDEHRGDAAEAGWGCGMRPRALRAEPPADCTDISPLTLQLRFPDCWDGVALDSDDHRSHVTRSDGGRCPASHPVLMTELQLSVVWPVTGPDGAGAALSSGPATHPHGDFLNGWDPDALRGRVELCIHAKANCTVG